MKRRKKAGFIPEDSVLNLHDSGGVGRKVDPAVQFEATLPFDAPKVYFPVNNPL
jgi:hypothetical protein